jgi:hypothetical protein
VELLVIGAKGEILAALGTGERSVGISQVFQLSDMGLDNVRTELEDYGMKPKEPEYAGSLLAPKDTTTEREMSTFVAPVPKER